MAIDSKKILGDTSTEWHARTATCPTSYISEGVHAFYRTDAGIKNYIEQFARMVPDNAEIVVNYKVSMGSYEVIVCGTALIKKK